MIQRRFVSRLGAVALAVLATAPTALQLVHDATVAHRYCAEHAQFEHGRDADAPTVGVASAAVESPRSAVYGAPETDNHAECAFLAAPRHAFAEPTSVASTPAPRPVDQPLTAAEAPRASTIALLRLAPKISPPIPS